MLPVPTPCDLVACERGGGRNVQRREVAPHRNAHEHVATLARETRETATLGAEYEHDRLVGKIEVEQAAVAPLVQTDGPTTGARRAVDRRGDAADERDGQVLDRAGRRLRDDRCDARGPVTRQDE